MELSSDRPSGNGPAPIPATSLDTFAQRYQLEADDFEKFKRMIRAMDTVFLERARAKLAQSRPGSKPSFPTAVSTKPMDKNLFDSLFGKRSSRSG
jgi:hypothetical protein